MAFRFGSFAKGLNDGMVQAQELQMKQDEMRRRQEEHDWKAAEQQRQQGERDVVARGLSSIGTDDYSKSFAQLTGMTPEQAAVVQQAAAASGNAGTFIRDRLADSAAGDTASVMQLQPQQVTRGMAMKNIAAGLGAYNADKALAYDKNADDELTKEKVMQINSLFNSYQSGKLSAPEFAKQAAKMYNTGINDGKYAVDFGSQMFVFDPQSGERRMLDLNNMEHLNLMRQQALMAVDPTYGQQYAQSLQHAITNDQGRQKLGLEGRHLDIIGQHFADQNAYWQGNLGIERDKVGIERAKAGAIIDQYRQLNPAYFMEGTDANGKPTFGIPMASKGGKIAFQVAEGGFKPLPRTMTNPEKLKQMDRWYKWVDENGTASDSQALAVASRLGLKPEEVGLGGMLPNADAVARATALAGKQARTQPTSVQPAQKPLPKAFSGVVPPGYYVDGNGGLVRGQTPVDVTPAGLKARFGGAGSPQFTEDDLTFFNR